MPLIERCRPADARLTVQARTVLHRPPMETPATAPIVRALIDAAGPGTGRHHDRRGGPHPVRPGLLLLSPSRPAWVR